MRIDEMRELIEQEQENLNVRVSEIAQSSTNRKVEGHRQAVNAARALGDTKAFKVEIDQILAIREFVDAIDPIVVSKESAQLFSDRVATLRTAASAVHRGLKALTLDTAETQVVFHLPGNQDLSGLVKDLSELDKLLTQAVVNEHVAGAVRLAGFDRGSEWLLIDLDSFKAVALLVMMHKYFIWWRKQEGEIALIRESTRSLKIDNDARKQLSDALDTQLKEHEKEAVALVLKAGGIPETDHELVQRVMTSIKSLETLVKNGLEIGPVTTTPDDLKELFRGAQSFPEAQKQLEDGLGSRAPAQDDEAEE